MVCSRFVEQIFDLLNLVVGPFLVHRTTVSENAVEHAQKTECDDCFFVDHVQFIADGPD